MAESLAKSGIYLDELNKIRVLDPEVSQHTTELKEKSKEFVEEIAEFQNITDDFITMVDKLAKEVEKEKMKAIGAQNLLKSVAKQREAEQQQLQALILEKSTELERLRVQYHSLQNTARALQDIIETLVLDQ